MKINEKMTDKDKNKSLIRKYQQYLILERSLSKNTLDAYLTDLDKLISYFTLENISFFDATLDDLHAFSAGLHDIGIHPRSQARIISGIKSFYRFLLLEDYIQEDPTELLESPKIGLKLPDVLTVNEIDTLIASLDLTKNEGQRNRAILETLYSCGLRVSELTNLKLSEVYFKEGFIQVEGKGKKQRLVPISPRAISEIESYLTDRCMVNIQDGYEDFLFLSRRGTNLSRIMIFHIIKEQVKISNIKKTVSPHTFRHSFATHLLEGGANLRAIQCMLGHESVITTEIYTHMDKNMLRSEIIEHHPRNIKYRADRK